MYETIKHVLCQNQLLMTDLPIPSKDEVIKYENEIKTPIPNWYKYFVELNGLNDLRFNFEMLHPRELSLNQKYISHTDFHVFATNGCGDVYCWSIHKPMKYTYGMMK